MDSMQGTEKEKHTPFNGSMLLLYGSLSIFLTSVLYLSYHLSNTNKGTIAIPAGKTYLGPTEVLPSWTSFSQPTTSPIPEREESTLFTVDEKTPWNIWKGKHFPYQFSYPETLQLTGFPNDPSDSAGISGSGKKPSENILMSVIELSKNKAFEPYVKKPKKEFVENWWKQFSGLSGVSTITEFTNKKGLKGYKTRFINAQGQTPNLDIFFEVPGKPELIIRIANGILDETVFDTIVESVSWGNKL